MSKASVKKAIKNLDQEALVEMIMELYAARKEAREYLDFWADPDINRETDRVKERLRKLFFLTEDKPRRKPDFTEAKTLLKNYQTLCHEPEQNADILIFFADTILRWLKARNGVGMKSNRKRLFDAIDQAAKEVEQTFADQSFSLRLDSLKTQAEDFYSNHTPTYRRSRWSRWW